ncbi:MULTISPECIES: excinuclease ABC subunit A [unclassified Campylobacter]|uniref:excinuclease ABC subunit A n=1 Tax=unclassified Campylobacter TaxID=2593542 RepID=UPI0022EA0F26|nr:MULTISPECIES: excinuclease ABC subunit A [unclassified Campylobacter]MDA3079348.1 excinuclease ABC subunit A [Campylobacter sp. CS_NA2]MDA3081219.1 excinuclease ABC subunit A [Campylobacter sp. CS_NA1]MDA3085770.1 excinuclease ABC subunit A [Campylobacter sp. CS_ED1]MDA3090182.1 excinuclease ABC subunit A [Campylobacter sp. CS_ED2]WBR51032.1 excinuclease ABC subunit A [Campylobacter sp. CS_NA3]
MKKFVLFLGAMLLTSSVWAKNEVIRLPISGALNDPRAKEVLDPSIKLYFGKDGGKAKKITQQLSANKKTNGVGKSDEAACNWAFLSAIKTFQERAKREGGSKVVNLSSYYYKNEFISSKEFECGVGNIMVGVTLRGYIAK